MPTTAIVLQDAILLSKSQCIVVERATALGIRKLDSKCSYK